MRYNIIEDYPKRAIQKPTGYYELCAGYMSNMTGFSKEMRKNAKK